MENMQQAIIECHQYRDKGPSPSRAGVGKVADAYVELRGLTAVYFQNLDRYVASVRDPAPHSAADLEMQWAQLQELRLNMSRHFPSLPVMSAEVIHYHPDPYDSRGFTRCCNVNASTLGKGVMTTTDPKVVTCPDMPKKSRTD